MNDIIYLIVGLGVIVIIVCIYKIVRLIIEDNYDDDDGVDYDDDDYDDDDYDDNEYDDARTVMSNKSAIEIIHPANYDTGDISYSDMMLRITRPHLYSDEWYDEVRRDFSRWAVIQYREIASFRREADAA